MSTVIVEVNARTVRARKGETILDACRHAHARVPTLCHIPGLTPSGACRMCVVEVDGMAGLVPSCSYPVADGMKIHTHSSQVIDARRRIIELLFSDHPDECLYCVRHGDCELQRLAREYGVTRRLFRGTRRQRDRDVSGPSIVRDPDKCVLCGKCVRVCEEIQSVAAIEFLQRGSRAYIGTAFDTGLNVSSCINCGQCVAICPTGALHEQSSVNDVLQMLDNPEKLVVVQHAPAVSVTIAEEFGFRPGTDYDGKMVAGLRRVGFDRVFDTSFSADLTIMEEASELIHRITTGGVLPMMTSCSPGWIKFVEQFYPQFIPNLSTCKSPQQMLGAIIKSYFAEKEGRAPQDIVSVSIMPCTAKKFEARRPEMSRDHVSDVDYVLTTRELAELLRIRGIDPGTAEPEGADSPFGERSSAGKLFGATGGVMEAAVRTAYHMLTGNELLDLKISEARGLKGSKELHLKVGDLEIGAVVVSALGNARALLEQLRAGREDLHFIEVMTCPGGCINGGGQPFGTDIQAVKARMAALYTIDRNEPVRVSHKNAQVARLYEEFLGEPLGEISHKLLHTRYERREVLV